MAKSASCHFQRQSVRGQTVKRMQVLDCGFEQLNVFLVKAAADIEIKCGQRHAMVNDADTANDDKFEAGIFEPREQGLIILRHGRSRLFERLIKSQSPADVPPTVARGSTSTRAQSETCQCPLPSPRARPGLRRADKHICR